MKQKMSFVLFICMSFAWVNSTLAANHQETLEALYREATMPASPEDFPALQLYGNEISKTSCIYLNENQNPTSLVIARMTQIIPSAGPLIPEERIEKLFFGPTSSGGFELAPPPFVNGADLIITNPAYYAAHSGTGELVLIPAHVMARKSGRLIPFQIEFDRRAADLPKVSYIGYCYPIEVSLF